MNKFNIIAIGAFFVIMMAVIWSIRLDTESHEQVHRDIFNDYGYDCNITIDLLGGGRCDPGNISASAETGRFINLGNEINDAVSYNLDSIKFYLGITLLIQSLLVVALLWREDDDRPKD